MTLRSLRVFVTRLTRLLGDAEAVSRPQDRKRMARQTAGRFANRWLGRWFR